MEEFKQLSWRIDKPSTLDLGTSFVNEESLAKTYVFNNDLKSCILLQNKMYNKNNNKLYQITNYPFPSCLNKIQHVQCLKALQLLETERSLAEYSIQEQQLINIYNNLMLEIHEENKKFLKYCEKEWRTNLHKRSSKVLSRDVTFIKSKLMFNLKTVQNYDKFYKEIKMVPISAADGFVEMNHEACLLEMGSIAHINVPNVDVSKINRMSLNKLPSVKQLTKEELTVTKLPVSQDIYAEQLAKQYDCNLVISSSGLKTIMDNYGPDYDAVWDIPVIAKEYDVNGMKKTITFIDKVIPAVKTNFRNLGFKCRRLLIKYNLFTTLGHRFNTPEQILKHYNNYKRTLKEKRNLTNADEGCSGSKKRKLGKKNTDDSCNNSEDDANKEEQNEIEENKEVEENKEEQNEIEENKELEENKEEQNEIKENKELEENELKKPSKTSSVLNNNQQKKGSNQNFHNVTYRIWKMKLNKNEKHSLLKSSSEHRQEIRLLVRCKTDGMVNENGMMKSVSIIPKMEYQWEHGGELITRSELIRQWTLLYFRPYSNLIRIRMNGTNGIFFKIENLNLNKIAAESLKHYNVSPTINLNVLYNTLSNLINISPGNYILHHTPKQGAFASLMKSVPESGPNTFDLHGYYDESNINIEKCIKWFPIDTTLILPYHLNHGLMPAIFPPKNKGKGQIRKTQKKKKKKKKKKQQHKK